MANFLSDLQKKYSDILNPINQGLSSYAHGVQQRFNTPSKIAPPPAQNNSIRSFINPIVNEAKNIVTQQIPSFQRIQSLTNPLANPPRFFNEANNQVSNFTKKGLAGGVKDLGMDVYNSAKLGANVYGGSKILAGGLLSAAKTILPNAAIGGGFNKLTGGSFSEGAGKGVAISPSIRGITGITNPLIEKYTQLLAPRIAPQLTNSAVGNYLTTSTLRGLQNIPEGAVIDATLGNRPMGAMSMTLDFASGFIPGAPNARGKSNVNVEKIKITPKDQDIITTILERKVNSVDSVDYAIRFKTTDDEQLRVMAEGYFGKTYANTVPVDQIAQDLFDAVKRNQGGKQFQLPQMGIIEGGYFKSPYKKGDITYLENGLKQLTGDKSVRSVKNISFMEELEGAAKSGDEGAKVQFDAIREMEREIDLARTARDQGNVRPQAQIRKEVGDSRTVEGLIKQGYKKDLAEFIIQNRTDMMDVKSPSLENLAKEADKYTRLASNKPTTVYRVSSKGKDLEDGKLVFTSKEKALKFREDYGFKRGQPEILERTVKESDLLQPKASGYDGEFVYHPQSPLKSHTQLGSATNTRADQIAGKFRQISDTPSLQSKTVEGMPLQSQSQPQVAGARPPLQNQSSSKVNPSTTSIQRNVKDEFEEEMDALVGKTFEKPFSGKSRVKVKQPVDLPGDQATTDFTTGRMAMGDGGGIKGLPKDTSDQFQLWVNRRRATDIEGFLKKKEFRDLDNKGVNGIFEFQAGNKSGRFGDVKRYFDAKYKTLQDNKIEFDYRQDYLPQLWNNSQDEINQVFGRRLGMKPSFTLEALFKSYEEGMNAGLKPKFGNISDLVGWYEQKANKALADKRFFDYLGHDGQILPSSKAPQEWVTLDPDRFPKFLSQIGDEKFAGTYKAPKELADVINNYLQGARFPFLEKVAGYVSKVKNITLNFGIPGTGINMHGVNILARHTLMGTGGNPISRFITGGKFMLAPNLAAKELDKSMINAPQAVKNGLSLSAEDYSGLMKQGEGFRAQFGRKWEAMFGDPLFNKMIPALKLSSYENLVKNGMNEKDAAKLINNVYGGINWEQMGRSKDMQNLIRIAILAPDWAESTLKIGGNFAKALNPLERSETVGRYRTMMATVFASYIAHNIVNKITSGHYSYENDPSNIFNIEIGYTDSGEKRYFRPYGTGLDMVRLPAEVAMGLYKGDLTGITRLLRNRLSIPAGVGLGLLTDQDYRGNAIGYRGTDKYGNEMPLSQRAGNITSEMASLVGVPAFTRQLYRGVSGQQGLEESLTQGLELPFRYSNTGNSNVQKQVDFIADEQGLKGKDRYDFNQQLKGQSKFSDNQLNVIKSYDDKSQGLKDTLQLRKVRSEVEKAKKGALKEGGINQADAAEETPITTNSNMQLEIAKSRVKMTKKTERVGDNIVYPTETGSSTLSLTPPTKGSGIGAYANKDWNITKAREVWNNDQLSKEDKDYAFKKLNVKAEDVRYDALANYSNDIKSQYLSSKSDTKEKLINNILTGRKRSIGDNIFASDGVIDSLVDEGKLTKEEGKALKAIDYNKDGSRKIKVGSGRGKKIKIPKVKAITIKFNKSKRIKVKQIKPKKVKQYKLSKVTKVKKLKV